MLNVVVPMAGRGSRFANAGYDDPKPLIRFGGKPMIQWVVENITPKSPHRFIFICLEEHLKQYSGISTTLRAISPGCEIVPVHNVTEGAACTVLLSRRWIDSDNPLMIANADQFVSLDIDEYLAVMTAKNADGLIMTFEADDAKWSFCRLRPDGTVSEVVEKQVVSNEATVGIYNFRRGKDFVRAADRMIAENLRVNNEFYVAPTYNQLIAEGAKIVVARTGREYEGMYGLGIPSDLDFFVTTPAYERGRLADWPPLSASDRIECLTRHFTAALLSGNAKGISAVLSAEVRMNARDRRLIVGRENVVSHLASLFKVLHGRNWTPNIRSLGGHERDICFVAEDAPAAEAPHFKVLWRASGIIEIEERPS